ncbi:NAD-glutamate dehydrogenase [Rhodococcus sp. BP-349]|uniref:NAD-glutamate dehydrogenase domain-containing protein n=1 Tax=unclassified Rhodococcus (in: high G+C Gram-positive bacteria) TaxID=192944 RepID=UPI001C9A7AF8|nr:MULTISPECIES: NAD-glutamate dehydrogenase domain-containing protein [unclassified Rhodococcus (in: high G+C Gram-positive bacteria)]MBY6537715.1 NAD-glutamate dehydrogenase [Rhodococcus sp. BP-363]MBY6542052.1 NAD-glutamate dehydrogenase [Rhodococcus sp. BP-369]MBY6561282.1 NAD-glutamate dehydrogenase [Rhodococcus sp. BP-370]MBY6575574.1 NAD-glutamate dehydrogenase [Rhodococcus sp. BP-364]MBY6584875.1 NAD-glutamate dehydrogenase [Rhodococcus sp. BP-358]
MTVLHTDIRPLATPTVAFTRRSATTTAIVTWPRDDMVLAEVCVMFERLGLRVTRHRSITVHESTTGIGVTDEFEFVDHNYSDTTLTLIGEAFAAGVAGSWSIDQYATLVSSARISWRQATLLRAMCRYLRQTPVGLSEAYLVDALASDPGFTRAVLRAFESRFDPAARCRDGAQQQLDHIIEGAQSYDQDRMRRAFSCFLAAVQRTNWFQHSVDGSPKSWISFKIDSSRLLSPGEIVPFREIFVCTAEVEGIHARSGSVARGGLRWSNRPEDFRTEVIGLMKTQAVKNAPIVPMGAKGAFVTQRSTTGIDGYTVFIRGLLDVTDNIVGGAVVHPPHTVCLDGDDAYLVVAADKGTASFSDRANAVAEEYDFWLGDAFASGGSTGYDHKVMGITARGAWLAVRRHFDEAGHDISVRPFTAVGIGDMSGDVFGNGMLLADTTRLVAAFDHRHIFLDPDPDPARSRAARSALFVRPESSWADYPASALSSGGGVWPRDAVSITLSPQARRALDTPEITVSPDELIRAILRASVDLLWNGGIGTYVRASTETDSDARDPTNDRVRITARDLRCAIVGEGGNLGLTQNARIEFALGGGRINADFIDNAAGVATSDREVNIKIALDSAVRAGRLTLQARNDVLAGVTDDVATGVLNDSDDQMQAISIAAAALEHFDRQSRLIDDLRSAGGIDPALEGLPTGAELAARHGRGLTRPEIATLLAQSKNLVARELLESAVPEDASQRGRLHDYFPSSIRRIALADITDHRLRREIVATTLADELVNRVGPGTIYWLQERFGVTTPDVARAYIAVTEIFSSRLPADLPNSTASCRTTELRTDGMPAEPAMAWLLRHRGGPIAPHAEVERYAHGVAILAAAGVLGEIGVSVALAVIDAAYDAGLPVVEVAAVHGGVDDMLGLCELSAALEADVDAPHVELLARAALYDELHDLRAALVTRIMLDSHTEMNQNALLHWAIRDDQVERARRVLTTISADGGVDLPRATAMLGVLRTLVVCLH